MRNKAMKQQFKKGSVYTTLNLAISQLIKHQLTIKSLAHSHAGIQRHVKIRVLNNKNIYHIHLHLLSILLLWTLNSGHNLCRTFLHSSSKLLLKTWFHNLSCGIKLRIIVTSPRHTCVITRLPYEHLDMPHLVKCCKGEVLTIRIFNK